MTRQPFTSARRQALLQEYYDWAERVYQSQATYDDESDDPQLLDDEFEGEKRMAELSDEYRAGVPIVPLSCCPYCHEVLHYSFDPYDLDGLWWGVDIDARPSLFAWERCPHFLVLTGAVQLTHPVTAVEHLIVRSGPEVPFVAPHLLEGQPVTAVISSVRVGKHQAYPIAYFSQTQPLSIELVREWGRQYYYWQKPDGEYEWEETYDNEEDYDFDLPQWIERGQVQWIAPGDDSFKLQSKVANCPYVGLSGRQEVLCIQGGNVWSRTAERKVGEEWKPRDLSRWELP